MKRFAKHVAALIVFGAAASGAWGQSAIPATAGTYLGVTGDAGQGDSDRFMVSFFEVPDTVSSPIYFAVQSPGMEDTNAVNTDHVNGDSRWNLAAQPTYSYHLVGGTGTISNTASRDRTFASVVAAQTGGELLSTITSTTDFPDDAAGWYTFPAVYPSQGEHIGNKYYFKVIAEAPSGSTAKNGFRLNVGYNSLSGTGTPLEVNGARAFAYTWTVQLISGLSYDLYPFVADTATNYLMAMNHDMDSTGSLTLTDTVAGAGNTVVSGNNTDSARASCYTTVAGKTGSTWHLAIGSGTPSISDGINMTEFWFENTVANNAFSAGTDQYLKTYSQSYTPATADHVSISPSSQTVKTSTAATYTLQIVDSSGNPVSYIRNVGITTSSATALINGVDNDEAVTTNSDGVVSFTVTDSVAESVSIALFTDGTHGSTSFGAGTDGSATLTVVTNPAPTISSAGNTSFTENNAKTLPTITVAANGGTLITAANDIRIRIPSTLTAHFNDTLITPTLTVSGTGTVNATVAYTDGTSTDTILTINVETDFGSSDTIDISGLALTSTNADGTGYLELSYNGGSSWTVIDDKAITILDTNQTYTWIGTTNDWAISTNWSPTGVPDTNTENALVPYMASGVYPTISSAVTINNLTVAGGATVTAGTNLTIAGSISSSGTISGTLTIPSTLSGTYTTGGGSLSFTSAVTLAGDTTINTGSGSVNFSGSGTVDSAPSKTYALYINSSGAKSFSANMGATDRLKRLQLGGTGAATFSGGTYRVAGNTLQFDNAVTISGDTIYSDTTGSIIFNSTLTINAGVTLTLEAPEVDFNGGANSVSGTGYLAVNPYLNAPAELANTTQSGGTLGLTSTDLAAISSTISGLTVTTTGGISWAGTATLKAPTTLAGNYTLTSGAMTLGAALGISGTATISGGTLTDGGYTITTTGSSVSLGGTLTLTGTWAFGASANLTSSGKALNNVSVGNTFTLTLQDAAVFGGDLTAAGTGALNANGQTIGIGGDWAITSVSNMTGTLTFNGSAAQAFSPASTTFTAITIHQTVASSVTADANVSTSGALTLSSGTLSISTGSLQAGSIAFSGGSIEANTAALDLRTDSLTYASGGITRTGVALTVSQLSNGTAISVNGVAALNLPSAFLTSISGTTLLTIGRSDATANTTIDGTHTFGYPVTFVTNAANSVSVNAAIGTAVSGAYAITFNAPTTLAANVSTDGGAVTFNQAATAAAASITIATESGGNNAAGNIVFASTLSADAGSRNLTLDARGSARGTVSFQAVNSAGGSLINDLTAYASAATFNSTVATTNNQTYNLFADPNTTQVLSGNALTVLITNATPAAITLTGSNAFASIDLKTTTDGSTTANAAVSYTDANGITIAGLATLGTATINAGGAISGTAAVTAGTLDATSDGGFSLSSTSNAISNFTAINTTSGAVALTNGATLTVPAGGISQYSGGTVTLTNTGAVTLTGNVGAGDTGTVSIDTGGASTITGAGTLTAQYIYLQPGTGTGAVGTALQSINTNIGAGTAELYLGNVAIAGAYVSHTGALTLRTPVLAANAPLYVTAAGLLTLPAAAISTGTGLLTLTSGTTLTTAGTLTSSNQINLTASAGALTIGHALSGGAVTLASSGGATILAAGITTTGDLIDLSGAASIVVGASVTLDSGSGDPATAGAITFGNVSTSANNTPYSLTLDSSTENAAGTGGTVSIGNFGTAAGQYVQNLTIDTTGTTAAGALTDTARTIIIPGTLTLDIGTRSTTTLLADGTSNLGTLAVTSAASVSVTDTNALDIGASTLTGSLTASAGGAITDSGAVSVGGAASFTTTAGGGAITLNDGATFSSTLALATNGTGDATVTGVTGNIDLAASTVGGDLTLSCAGATGITDAAAISVTGDSSFTVANGSSIVLNTATNAFSGSGLALAAAAGNIADITVYDTTEITLPAVTITGNLVASTTTGAITEAGALVVPGTSAFTTGASAITLTSANDFGGAVTFTNTGADVQLTDANAISLAGTSSTGGNLTVIAGGAITDTGTLSVTGAATFETHLTGGANITIDDDGVAPWSGNFGSIVLRSMDTAGTTPDAGTLVLREASATVVDGIRTTGQATVQSAGTIIDSVGAVVEAAPLVLISVGGTALDSASCAVASLNAANTSSGAIAVTNTATTLTVTGLTQSAAATVSITNTGSGGIAVSGTITATASTGVALTADDFDLTAAVNAGTNNVAVAPYTAGTDIFLGGSGTGISLSATELNQISTSGTLTIGGAAHTGDITVNGAVALTGPTGPVVLGTDGGAIAMDAAFATAANAAATLALNARTASLNTGTVGGAGQITAGNTGDAALTVTAGAGINLSNTSNRSNAVTLANSTSGNVAYYNNLTMALSASNSAANGTLTVVNGTGNITTGSAITTAGAGAADISLQTAGTFALNNAVTAAGTGFVSLSGDGATQTAAITAPGGLHVGGIGASTFALTQSNVVTALAANVTGGSLSLTAAGALEVGTVNGITGATVSGTLTLSTGGAITQTQIVDAATLALTNTAALTNLSTNSNVIDAFGTIGAAGQTVRIYNTVASTQSGAITASALELTGTAGYTWTNTGNNIATFAADIGTAALSYRDTDAVAIGTVGATSGIGATGGFTLVAGGAITQSQAINVGAAGSLSVSTWLTGGAAITLNTVANEAGTVTLRARDSTDSADTAGAIAYRDATGFTVAGARTASTLSLQGGGLAADDLGQSGLIAAGGTFTIIAGLGDAIFNTATNAFATVTATSAAALTLNDADGYTLAACTATGAITANTAAGGINVTGALSTAGAAGMGIDLNPTGTITLQYAGGTIAATDGGLIRLRRAVTLAANATIDSDAAAVTGGNVQFDSTINGAFTLGVDASAATTAGTITFTGAVATITSLSATGTIAVNGGTMTTTTGGQTYTGPVTLGSNTNFTSDSGTLVHFADTLGGGATARTVTVTTANARFDNTVGGVGNLVTSLSVTAGTTALYADVTTEDGGSQSYTGAATLYADCDLLSGTGTITFSNTIGQSGTRTLTLQNGTATGLVTLSGAVTLQGLAFGSGNYNVVMSDTGSTIASLVEFLNQGTLSLGQAAGTITFNGGVETTGNGTNPSLVTTYGTIASSDDAITLGAITLGADTTLDTNATATNTADIAIGAVTLSTFTLTLETASGVASADVNGTSVSGTGTLALQNIGGTASFSGVVSAGTLNVPNTVVNASFAGSSGTITNAVAFHNTGTLRLGAAGGTLTFSGGIDTAAAPAVGGTVTIYGTILTSSDAVTFSAITLGADTILDTSGAGAATVTLGTVAGGTTYTLEIRGGVSSSGTITAGYLRIVTSGNIGSAGTALATDVDFFEGQAGGLVNLTNTDTNASSANLLTIGFSTGSFDVTGVSSTGGGAITLTAGNLALTEAIASTGALTLQPLTALTTVSIGAAGGTFAIEDGDIALLTNGFSSVTIGRSTSGIVTVDTATFTDPITILGGGDITIAAGSPSLQTSASGDSITVTSSGTADILVNGDVAASGAGAVTFTSAGDIAMDASSSIASGSGAIILDADGTAAGSLVLDAVQSGGGQITLRAGTAGSITEADNTALVSTTGLLFINDAAAGSSIGTATAGEELNINVGALRVQAAGNVYISEADSVQLGNAAGDVSTTGGLIDISAATSIAIANNVASTSSGNITLAAGTGAITRSAGTITTTGGVLALTAGTYIGTSTAGNEIYTDVGTLRAAASSGGIYIVETNGIQLGDGSGDVTADSGNIVVNASGSITTGGTIETTTSGNISLTSSAGAVTLSTTVNSVGTLSASASTLLTLGGTVTAGTTGSFTGTGSGIAVTGAVNGGTGLATFNNATTNTGTITSGAGGITYISTFSGTGSLVGSTVGVITFQGNTTLGSLTPASSTFAFTGTLTPQSFDSNNNALPSVSIAKGAVGNILRLATSNVTQTAGSSLTITAGTLDLDTNTRTWTLQTALAVGTSAVVNVGAGSLLGGQALTITGTGLITHGTGTITQASLGVSGTGTYTGTGTGTLTITNALSMSAGTLTLGSKTISAATINITGGDLNLGSCTIALSSAPNVISTSGAISDTASLITLNGAGNLTLDTDATIGNLTVGANTVLVAGGLVKNLTINGTYILDLSGASTAVNLSLAAGSALTATGTLRVLDDTNPVLLSSQTAGTAFTYSGTDIDYNANAITLTDMNASTVDTDIEAGAVATISSTVAFNNIILSGTLTVNAAATLNCAALNAALGSVISYPGAAATTATISASGNVSIAGSYTFNSTSAAASATLAMTGSGVTLAVTPQIGNLTVNSAGTVQLVAALALAGDVTISAGVLDSNAYKITIAGDRWQNDVGAAGFAYSTAEVEFTNSTGPIYVTGSTSWYNFTFIIPGVTMRFEQNETQTIYGDFKVKGSAGSYIVLTRDNADQTSDLNWTPPAAPNAALMWQIHITSGATITMQYVELRYSDARARSVIAPDDVTLYTVTPAPATETGKTCYRWLAALQALYSFTEDTDGNGKIDRIRVQAAAGLNGNFSGFTMNIDGYTIDTSKGTNGYTLAGTGSDTFYVAVREKPYLDGGATPTWNIAANTTLKNYPAEKYLLDTILELMTTTDTIPPRFGYAMTMPGCAETFLQFSENVYGSSGGAALSTASFTATPFAISSITPITSSGNGMSEALLSLASAPGVAALATPGSFTLNAANVNDQAAASPDYATDPLYIDLSLPAPLYPTVYGNYAAYDEAPAHSGSGLPPPNYIVSDTHRLTDVLISVPPSSATDATYFVWPIWARDSVTTEIAQADYETLSASDSALQTIGLIRDFTGTQWLRDQDITLEARVNPLLGTPSAVRLFFDTAVSGTYTATSANGSTGLWLPTFSEPEFSGIVPYPNTGISTIVGGNASGALWDFTVPSADAKVKSGVTLGFSFTMGPVNATNPLYAARLNIAAGASIPTDWYRRVLPFSFDIHDVTKQRGSVTILNNVINPNNGETTRISYQLSKSGRTSIEVFTLDGDMVKVLYRGTRAAGDYTAIWDGKNMGGRAVARGIYFIRVVAPEIDEIRKVLVVK